MVGVTYGIKGFRAYTFVANLLRDSGTYTQYLGKGAEPIFIAKDYSSAVYRVDGINLVLTDKRPPRIAIHGNSHARRLLKGRLERLFDIKLEAGSK